ncbi:hypothetical protein H5410_046033 [Solanum commersonii]|uniref:Uncharacterized protein n=1 Tax=Solanum commersonii TaxID=4109 RepID=A0A9J5XDB9_SOLCO|nr:hypothetical protein H5410_046033 [Solanum commersonii]
MEGSPVMGRGGDIPFLMDNIVAWKKNETTRLREIWRRLDRSTRGRGCRDLVLAALAAVVYGI